MSQTRAGFIAVVGRPNVGKSTLINALVGARVSITTPKPQTTRHRILGIRTEEAVQMIFVDTPGIHVGGKSAMNRMLNQTATDSVRDADCVLWLVQSGRWTDEDAEVLERLRGLRTPVGLIVTKVDLVKAKTELMPFIAELSQRRPVEFVVPISATVVVEALMRRKPLIPPNLYALSFTLSMTQLTARSCAAVTPFPSAICS